MMLTSFGLCCVIHITQKRSEQIMTSHLTSLARVSGLTYALRKCNVVWVKNIGLNVLHPVAHTPLFWCGVLLLFKDKINRNQDMSGRANKRTKLSEDGEANGMQADFLKGSSNSFLCCALPFHRLQKLV